MPSELQPQSQSKLRTELKPKQQAQWMHNLLSPVTGSRLFRYLWLGQLISVLGSSVTTVILPVLVYSITGSTTTMGLMMAVYMLPNVLMLPFSGRMVDRSDRVGFMILSDIVRFLVMLTVAALIFADRLTIELLFGLVGLYGLMDGLFQPAYSAVRAVVFTPDIRNAANSLTQIGNQTVRLIGPALGGVIIATLSAGFGFGLDALTYLFSFFCLLYLRGKVPAGTRRSDTSGSTDWKMDFNEGLAVLKSHPWLWITILAFSIINICFTGVIVVLVPWLFQVHYGLEPYVYGLAVTCSGGGAVAAALLFGAKSRWRKRGLLAYGGSCLSGVALLSMAFTPSSYGLCALFALEGFGMMTFGLIWETSLQELVPQEAFGRVASLDMLGSFALLPLGYILVGWSADLAGGVWTMAVFAGLGILTVASVLFVPSIRRFD